MRVPRVCALTGMLGLAVFLLWGCGISNESGPAQYAVLHPADQPVARLPLVDVYLEKPAKLRPVRSLLEMRHENVIIQSWDLSCGAAALATLLKYEWGMPVTEKQVANGLMARREYIENPSLVQ